MGFRGGGFDRERVLRGEQRSASTSGVYVPFDHQSCTQQTYLPDVTEQPASYLMIEPRFIARLRARIRLNRPSFNASLSTRRIVFSDTCPHCESREDIQHVLLECYAYEAARHRLQNALWSLVHGVESPGWSLFGSLHGVRAVTGEVSHVPPRCRLEVLRLSAAFLLDVDAIRPI